MSRRIALHPVRIVTWSIVLLAGLYLAWRFEIATLPEGSCSPVLAVSPGERMWIDLDPGEVRIGDVVLFRDPDGEKLLLGKVAAAPASLTSEATQALARGWLWIIGDVSTCPARDSRLFGPVAPESVTGRLLLSW